MENSVMKKGRALNVVLVIALLAGISLLLYPGIADLFNRQHQTKAVASYVDHVEQLNQIDYETFKSAAEDYNTNILPKNSEYILSDEMKATYNSLLNIDGSGIMGYVDIPTAEITLPIYHGTEDDVLRVGAGHLEWTSLPVGGEGTHCVLSGHRGLPSARLFTDLDKLEVGDCFMLHVIDEVLTYEVDQILIVEPDTVEALAVCEGEDLCTLMTCTPYGLNTHRIMIRGKRIETKEETVKTHITSEAVQIEPLLMAPIAAIPLLFILFIIFFFHDRRKTRGD